MGDINSEETIFSTALGIHSPKERLAYLKATCSSPDSLRRIETLLAAQTTLGSFMEDPPVLSQLDIVASIQDPNPPAHAQASTTSLIGNYQILHVLGEGGCGIVYLAEQSEPLRRQIALKVIKQGMDTKAVIARFNAERQALAMMNHPNIAKILDAGTTDTGRPFFVMELVRGARITTFCDQLQLSNIQRIHLFLQVCHAVQHAHQKGIIHRDLKPSNILVSLDNPQQPPIPKIIDFGIAKAIQGKLTDQTLFTATDQLLGTPAYMSPEQANRSEADIDTRTDIYSLGVLLYELLVGRPPFDPRDLMTQGVEVLRQTLQNNDPPKPSTRFYNLSLQDKFAIAHAQKADPVTLTQKLQGDLDVIILKCLEKDRTRRYESADALSRDLQRYLSNEPISARPPTLIYELRKSFLRHKPIFISAAFILVALVAGTLVSTSEALRARRAEQEARRISYVSDMALAARAVLEENLGLAQDLLRRHVPHHVKEQDYRNWEWRYLAQSTEGAPHKSLHHHSSFVSNLDYFNKTNLLTTGMQDWRTVLWDLQSLQPRMVMTNRGTGGGPSTISAVSRSKNLFYYRASWRNASGLTVLNLTNGLESPLQDSLGKPSYLSKPIRHIALSPDERQLSISYANKVGLWDVEKHNWTDSFPTESTNAVQGGFSPDGQLLLVADEAGLTALWNIREHQRIGVITNRTGWPGALTFSKDGQWLAQPGMKAPVRIWNVHNLSLVTEIQDEQAAEMLAFSPDRQYLAAIGSSTTVRIWDTTSWKSHRVLHGHTDTITTLTFSPTGDTLATGARNGEVKLWNLFTNPHTPTQTSFAPSQINAIIVNGTGFARLIPSPLDNGSLIAEIWSSQPFRPKLRFPAPKKPFSKLLPLSDGQSILFTGSQGDLFLASHQTNLNIHLPAAHEGEIYAADVSRDGTTLATKAVKADGNPENRIRLWQLPTLKPITELPHAYHIHGLKLSDDGRWLAGFTGPGDVGVWKIPEMKGPPMWHGVASQQRVEIAAFSPDNQLLAAATPDGNAYIWNLTTHRTTMLPRALTFYTCIAFSPDSSRLAAGTDLEIKLFDTLSGRPLLSIPYPAQHLAFGRNGESILALHNKGASLFRAPSLKQLQFDWLTQPALTEAPPYRGPNTNYERPDRF